MTSKYNRFRANKKTGGDENVTAYLRRVAVGREKREDGRALQTVWIAELCEVQPLMILVVLLLGLGVGVLVGLMGIGGGVVLVPAMVYLLRMDQHLAQGTSLFIMLPPIGLGAMREYWKQGEVDLRAGILCALGILLGAYGGSLVALPMRSRKLEGLFGCFLMLAAALLWRKAWLEGKAAEGRRRKPNA